MSVRIGEQTSDSDNTHQELHQYRCSMDYRDSRSAWKHCKWIYAYKLYRQKYVDTQRPHLLICAYLVSFISFTVSSLSLWLMCQQQQQKINKYDKDVAIKIWDKHTCSYTRRVLRSVRGILNSYSLNFNALLSTYGVFGIQPLGVCVCVCVGSWSLRQCICFNQ